MHKRLMAAGLTFCLMRATYEQMIVLKKADARRRRVRDGNYTDVARKLTQNGAQMISAGFKEFPGFGEQLWQNLTFRAVENHTAVVVTGATSVASIVDPYGRIVALDVNKDGSDVVLVGDVTLGSGKGTLYTSLGDVLGWVTLAGLVGFMVYQSVEGRKAKKAAKS